MAVSKALLAALQVASLVLSASAFDNMVYGEDPRKPVEVDKDLMCEACHAIFDVWRKRIGSKHRTETLIYETFEEPTKICDQKNLRVYKAIPPTMQKGCEGYLDKYGDGIEETFYKEGDGAEETMCAEVCAGINREPGPPKGGPGGFATEGVEFKQGEPAPPPKKKSKKKRGKKKDAEL